MIFLFFPSALIRLAFLAESARVRLPIPGHFKLLRITGSNFNRHSLVIIVNENVLISLSSDKLFEICFLGALGALSVLLCPETVFCLVFCSLRNMPMSRFSPSKLLQCDYLHHVMLVVFVLALSYQSYSAPYLTH